MELSDHWNQKDLIRRLVNFLHNQEPEDSSPDGYETNGIQFFTDILS